MSARSRSRSPPQAPNGSGGGVRSSRRHVEEDLWALLAPEESADEEAAEDRAPGTSGTATTTRTTTTSSRLAETVTKIIRKERQRWEEEKEAEQRQKDRQQRRQQLQAKRAQAEEEESLAEGRRLDQRIAKARASGTAGDTGSKMWRSPPSGKGSGPRYPYPCLPCSLPCSPKFFFHPLIWKHQHQGSQWPIISGASTSIKPIIEGHHTHHCGRWAPSHCNLCPQVLDRFGVSQKPLQSALERLGVNQKTPYIQEESTTRRRR